MDKTELQKRIKKLWFDEEWDGINMSQILEYMFYLIEQNWKHILGDENN